MCGIIGYYNINNNPTGRTTDEIIRLRDLMYSRGPDDAGVLVAPDQGWALGHRRLSIIDLSRNGRQPMSNNAGSIHITYNGEIYNYRALRKRIELDGYAFRSTSDTEVILALYEKMGLDCLPLLDGMFAMMIVDTARQKAFIVRDPVGKKPLYYAMLADTVMVASDPGVIARDKKYTSRINSHGLYSLLAMGGVKSPDSMFQGIHKLVPGSYMEIQCGFEGEGRPVRYRSPLFTPLADCITDEHEALGRIDAALGAAVEKRMISDVPFGLFLSGGIDSALILSYMAEHTDHVNTFSIETESSSSKNRETVVAGKLAARYATNHHMVSMDDAEYIELLDSVIFRSSSPVTLPDAVLAVKLAGLARENNVYVVETGEGADELFMGYRNYIGRLDRGARQSAYASRFGGPLSLLFSVICLLHKMTSVQYLGRKAQKINALRHAPLIDDYFYKPFHEYEVAFRMERKYTFDAESNIYAMLNDYIEEHLPGLPSEYGVDTLSYLWNSSFRLPDFLLDRVDHFTMEHSVEARAPFMDMDVVTAGLQIAPALKQKDGWPKYILRKLAEKRISAEHAYRPKRGFGGSNENMVSPQVGKYLWSCLSSSPSFRECPVFGKQEIRTPSQLFVLTSLHRWMDQWL